MGAVYQLVEGGRPRLQPSAGYRPLAVLALAQHDDGKVLICGVRVGVDVRVWAIRVRAGLGVKG